jgi:hypothetical protein
MLLLKLRSLNDTNTLHKRGRKVTGLQTGGISVSIRWLKSFLITVQMPSNINCIYLSFIRNSQIGHSDCENRQNWEKCRSGNVCSVREIMSEFHANLPLPDPSWRTQISDSVNQARWSGTTAEHRIVVTVTNYSYLLPFLHLFGVFAVSLTTLSITCTV